MKVSKLMSQHLFTIKKDDNLHQAAELMWKNDCGSLPVLDNNDTLVGMITDRDIAMAGYTNNLKFQDMKVNSCMSKAIYSCSRDDEVQLAQHIMEKHQIRRLPVLDSKNKLIGIITLNDLAVAFKKDSGKTLKGDSVAKTLASICTHRDIPSASAA